MDVDKFCEEACVALNEQTVDALGSFVEKWVPIVTNTVRTLKQENALLDLTLSAEQEG